MVKGQVYHRITNINWTQGTYLVIDFIDYVTGIGNAHSNNTICAVQSVLLRCVEELKEPNVEESTSRSSEVSIA